MNPSGLAVKRSPSTQNRRLTLKLKITTTHKGNLSDGLSSVPIECPHCGHKIVFKLTGLKADPLITCDACHKKTQIESGGTLAQTAKDLADLDRSWSNLFK
jgi:transposase-like protein